VVLEGRRALSQSDSRFVISGLTVRTHTVRTQMIGYAPVSHDVTVADGAPTDVDFTLAAQAIGLSALVVVGYGEQNAGNITGAVKQMDSSEVNRGRMISPEQLSERKITGRQV